MDQIGKSRQYAADVVLASLWTGGSLSNGTTHRSELCPIPCRLQQFAFEQQIGKNTRQSTENARYVSLFTWCDAGYLQLAVQLIFVATRAAGYIASKYFSINYSVD